MHATAFPNLRADSLFQQPIDIHFTSRAQIYTPVHHHRNHETRRHPRAIASVVGLRTVDRLSNLPRLEGVEYRWPDSSSALLLRGHPHNRVFVSVGRDRRRGTVGEL